MRPALLKVMLDLDHRRVPYALCTVVDAKGSVPGKPGFAMVVTAEAAWGTVGGAGLEERVKRSAREALPSGGTRVHRFDLANWKEAGLDSVCGGTVDVSVQVVRPRPHVLLVGAGHVAKALADAAALLEWRVTVVDDREDHLARERFPNAEARVAGDAAKLLRSADLSVWSHAYVLGYDHHKDTDALVSLLVGGFAGHVGVVGSRAKRTSMFERALKAGVDEARLAAVQCPIGLDIGATTPEEIAAAVVAEIIALEKGKVPS